MSVDPVKLTQFIVCQDTEFGASLSPIRVVKFLYLADLYYARENKGETLTGWPWKFDGHVMFPFWGKRRARIQCLERFGV